MVIEGLLPGGGSICAPGLEPLPCGVNPQFVFDLNCNEENDPIQTQEAFYDFVKDRSDRGVPACVQVSACYPGSSCVANPNLRSVPPDRKFDMDIENTKSDDNTYYF